MNQFTRLFLLCLSLVGATAVSGYLLVHATTPTAPVINLADAFPHLTFASPVDISHAGDNRLFIVEQVGRIRVTPLDPTTTQSSLFLNISDRVISGGEMGLLGLAFHPNYAQNGYFYVNYTHDSGQLVTRISRFQVTADPNVADPNSELILLQFAQPASNHNGGDLNFGPDGYLYIGNGDGGSAGDPWNNGQTMTALLGKMLRLDVDGGGLPPDCDPDGQYTIPADNPFVAVANACGEIWHAGVRNPWRFSFDRLTGDLFIADVGQGTWEEVNFQPAGDAGGKNYGWRCYEGNHPYNLTGCSFLPSTYTFPVTEYSHSGGNCSITGGYMYRGREYPGLQNYYYYGDYCSGRIWGLTYTDDTWSSTQLLQPGGMETFGEDACGGVYVNQGGKIYRLRETGATPQANPCLSKSGPAVVDYGDLITYTIRLNNTGPTAETAVTVTDTLPSGTTYVSGGTLNGQTVTWNLGDLPAYSSTAVQLVIRATSQQPIVNAEYGLSGATGFVPGLRAVTTAVRLPSLNISKTGPHSVAAGAPITYTLTVENNGLAPATNLHITDTLPLGATYISGGTLNGADISWPVDTLDAAETVSVQFVVTATTTITNVHYAVLAEDGFAAVGRTPVITLIETETPIFYLYIPMVIRP